MENTLFAWDKVFTMKMMRIWGVRCSMCWGHHCNGKNFVPPVNTRSPVVEAVKLWASNITYEDSSLISSGLVVRKFVKATLAHQFRWWSIRVILPDYKPSIWPLPPHGILYLWMEQSFILYMLNPHGRTPLCNSISRFFSVC